MTIPSDELAARITKRLAAEGLLLEHDSRRLTSKIADGSAKRGDWRLAVEKATEKAGGAGEADGD